MTIRPHLRTVSLIALLVVVIRLPALLQSSTGLDEGLYALVARDWLSGHLPYTTVWETKPPVFFALLAAAMAVFGKTVIGIRIANDIAIAATAIALYAIGLTLPRDGKKTGVTAACFYAALTISDSGLSAVAEAFYVPFVATAFALVLAQRGDRRATLVRAVAIGTCLAAAVLVKESAALEAIYAAAIALWMCGIGTLVPMVAASLVVTGAAVAPYALTGTTPLFWDANVASILRRAGAPVPGVAPFGTILIAQLQAFFPATLLAFGLPWIVDESVGSARERRLAFVMLGWAGASLATVFTIREFLGNHFIGAMAPASAIGAIVTVGWARKAHARAIVPAAIAVAVVAHAGYQFVLAAPVAIDRIRSGDPTYGDATAELAAYVNAHRGPAQTLYVADDRAVLYLLADAEPPTRFAYSAHLLEPYQELIAGANGPAEIRRILATEPAFVIRNTANITHEDPPGAALLDAALQARYHTVFSVGTRSIYLHDGAAFSPGMNAP